MDIFVAPLVVGLILLIFFALAPAVRRFRGLPTGDGLYEAAPTLLSEAERSFFGVLQMVSGANYYVFAKVRLADVVRPVRALAGRQRQAAFNGICAKHVDFVLCEPKTMRLLAVIELDDRSHSYNDRKRRDAFVDSALASAGIPVLRVTARQAYSVSEIREQIIRTISGQEPNQQRN
jgi:very-short-patch-repair endonuclease